MQSLTPSSEDPKAVRERSFAAFHDHEPVMKRGNRHWLMRGQNFIVEWMETGAAVPEAFEVESAAEMLLLLPSQGALIENRSPAAAAAAVRAGGHSVAILPAGKYTVRLDGAGSCAVLATDRPDVDAAAVLNAEAYRQPDARIRAAGRPYVRKQALTAVQVFDMDAVAAPLDNPRLKMFQTETMSINWVEYVGMRDRSALSPHSHQDFEQGSLAIAGNYLHHLRVEWGKNAGLWRDDEHLQAPSPSLMVVPVNMIHTTEGIGDGHHLLIDVFSPPRQDFIGKNWVYNAADYEAAR